MKKLLVLTLALASALSLAACGGGSGGGDTYTGMSYPAGGDPSDSGQAGTSAPVEAQQLSGDARLVGVWTPREEYAFDYAGGVEFKADGTFITRENSEGVGYSSIKGRYTLQGDQIVCTNVTYSWTEYGYQGRNYADRPGGDLVWPFYFTSSLGEPLDALYPDTTWLMIDFYPDDPVLSKESALQNRKHNNTETKRAACRSQANKI